MVTDGAFDLWWKVGLKLRFPAWTDGALWHSGIITLQKLLEIVGVCCDVQTLSSALGILFPPAGSRGA